MLGNVIMAMSAVMQLNTPIQAASTFPPLGNDITSLIITISNADYSRSVSNTDVNRFPFVERYFRSDQTLPFSITVSTAEDPVIPGTRIPIYRIAALLDGGNDVDGVMKDYPSLNRVQIEDAFAYAKTNPYIGRTHYPPRSLKSAIEKWTFMFI